MIPQHLINRGATASAGMPLNLMHPEDAQNAREDARAVLEAVAADIYDRGYDVGHFDGECHSYTGTEHRPYRRNENA